MKTKPRIKTGGWIILATLLCALAYPAFAATTVTVTSPNGGENWTAGSAHNVTWSISGTTTSINYQLVALSTDGGVTYNNIGSTQTPSSRSMSWTIPAGTSSTQVRIRVRALDVNANILGQDTSDNIFTISNPSQPNLTPYQNSGWSDKIVVARTASSTTDSTSLTTADTLYVNAVVINNGAAATAINFQNALFVDGVEATYWVTTPPLNVNYISFLTTGYPIGQLSAGTHTIKITADYGGVIAESNEGDNSYTKTISVGSSQGSSVSSSLSTLTAAPSSAAANGQSIITATVTLRNANNNPVAGKIVQVHSGGSVAISQPANPTDANGQATATITATMPVTTSIWAVDTTDSVVVQQQPTIQFTSASVLPNTDLSQAIGTLYLNTADNLTDATLSITTVGTQAGSSGDAFRAAFGEDKAMGVFNAVLGIGSLVVPIINTAEFARLIPLPGLEETGAGSLIENSPLASRLLDLELLQNQVTSRVLKSGLLQVAAVAKDEADAAVFEADLPAIYEEIAGQPNGLSLIAQGNAQNCLVYQQALQQRSQQLVSQGIPPLTAAQQTAWANDLLSRYGVGTALIGVLSHENQFLQQYSLAKQQSSQNAIEWLLAKFAVEAAATVFFDGPGAIVAGGTFIIADEHKTLQQMSTDQAGYNMAFSVLGGCVQYAGQTYLNAASAYNEISQNKTANPVSAQIGAMTDSEEGYQAWGPLFIEPKFSVTKAYSILNLQNTSAGSATFEVVVLSGYSSSAYGVNIPNLSQVTIAVVNLTAQANAAIPITYYDGKNGGTPDASTSMSVYVLGNNISGTFYIGGFSHNWSPATVNSAIRPLTPQPPQQEMENPVSCYVIQNPTNQTYEANIFTVNPFSHTYSAVITQTLPVGITVLSTDGTLGSSSIVWTNTIAPGGLAKEAFSFTLSVLPGVSTNLPPPTVTFMDQTNNPSGLLTSVTPDFSGLFPVQVNGFVPKGVSGIDSPMQVSVTNLTGTSQTGSLNILITDSMGNTVTNFSQAFSVNGLAGTNLNFALPGTLPPGSYSLTGSLNMNGGNGQVLAGVYVVPVAPITLGFGSPKPLGTNGINLTLLQGPLGSNYVFEFSTDLFNWTPFVDSTVTNLPFNFNDSTATNSGARFYRAVMLMP